ncbi:MAG TPA: biotin/lipoyl-containing protein, partial [Steroidobacteraceae bacterium]
MSSIDLVVPDLGSFNEVSVVDVLVKAGDTVEVDTPLVTLETDKASMDVPATAAGKIAEVLLKRGDKVSKGALIARVETNSQAGAPAGKTEAAPAATGAKSPSPACKSPPPPPPSAPAAKPESGGDTVRMPAPDLTKPPPGQVDFNRSTQLLVLGSGPGGYTAAFRAADLGMQVTLVERWPMLGGVCLNVG